MRPYLTRALALAALAIALAPPGLAHDNSKPLSPQHGGELVEIEHHAIELVLTASALTFHVSEHGAPLDVTGTGFKAVVQTPAGTRVIDLKAEGSLLSAPLETPLPQGSKVALTGKDKDGAVIQARFVTK